MATEGRWARVEEIYNAALERPESERAAFLRDSCSDDEELRREVESLLKYEGRAKEFLEPPSETTSALPLGGRVSAYRVLEKLGAGGMGEVYRAVDTRLGRQVALKVLPRELAGDPARKARFDHEARAASALNDPNIVTIYDIGRDGDIDFLVMEYVPGKTLADLIPRKGMPVSEALRYATQVAGALAKAHAAGIVHRDLKPGNIMVTPDGVAKVLDFGLAKFEEAPQDDDSTRTARPRTAEGVVLGTVGYMSPEQAEGRPVDSRSDIFSFGSLLYEMLTGRRPFDRDSKLSTVAAILHDDPPPLSERKPHIRAELERMVMRCLRKQPERRWQSMADLKVAVEELKEESDSGNVPTTKPWSGHHRRFWIAPLAGTVVVISAATLWWALQKKSPPAEDYNLVHLTAYPGTEYDPEFSPDGRQVAFSWDGDKEENFDIYVKLIGSEPPLRLTTDPRADNSPAWSPDGRWIAFTRILPETGKQAVLLVSPLGGPEHNVAEVADLCSESLAWTPDSSGLLVSDRAPKGTGGAVFLISLNTAQKRQITYPPPASIDCYQRISPDGNAISFTRAGTASGVYVARVSRDFRIKGEPLRVNQTDVPHDWMNDSRSLIVQDAKAQSLWRIGAFDPRARMRLPFGEEGFFPRMARQSSRLVYSRRTIDVDIWLAALGKRAAGSGPVKFLTSTLLDDSPEYSPDGHRIAFVSNRSGQQELWVADSGGSAARELATPPGSGGPRWSPDGRHIVFESGERVWRVAVESGLPQRITSEQTAEAAPSYSHDGKWVYYACQRSGETQICKVPANGGTPVQITRNGGTFPLESYDERSIFYVRRSKDLTSSDIWKVPTSGGPEVQTPISLRLTNFAVTRQGVYYISGGDLDHLAELRLFDPDSGSSSLVLTLPKRVRMIAGGLSISPDYQWALFSLFDLQMDLMLVENFR